MPTHRLPLQPVLSAAEYAALDRFGAAHPGAGNLAAAAAFLSENFQVDLSTDPEIVAGFAGDSSHLPGRAQALARPPDERGCAAVLRLCRAAGVPVTFSGGKSNLTGSATPPDGVVLSTVRMLEPAVRVDAAGQTAAAPVGLLLEDMRREISKQTGGRRRYPVDPTSRADATVGGCLACNASGFTPGEQGATRAWVQSLRFLLPDGMLVEAERNQYVSAGGFLPGRRPRGLPWPVSTYPRRHPLKMPAARSVLPTAPWISWTWSSATKASSSWRPPAPCAWRENRGNTLTSASRCPMRIPRCACWPRSARAFEETWAP